MHAIPHALPASDGPAPPARRARPCARPIGSRTGNIIATAASHCSAMSVGGEFIAVGGRGGCIPVIVVPDRVRTILPHSAWLNYCEFAFLVRTQGAKYGMADVLRRLEAVTAEEAAAKHAALRRVRDAFVWRPPAEGGPPSAAHFLLLAARAKAREARARNFTPSLAELRDTSSRLDPLGAAGGPGGHVVGQSVDGDAAGVLASGGSCLLA